MKGDFKILTVSLDELLVTISVIVVNIFFLNNNIQFVFSYGIS